MSNADTKEFLEELKEQAKSAESRAENDELTYVDPSDGTVYEWDSDKKGWFPKVFIHLVFPIISSYKLYTPLLFKM